MSTAASNAAEASLDRESGRLSLVEKIGYSFGDAASNFYWKTFEFFIMFFYTDVFGISAYAVGLMLMVTRIGDAVIDPVMGSIADRTKTRWGHFRPYVLWFALPLAVAGVLTFTTPHIGHGAKLIYAYATYSFLMLMYTAVNIPYSALMGVMTPNSKERTSLASMRFIGAFVVASFVQYCTRSLAQWFGMDAAVRAQRSFLADPYGWVRWFFSKEFMLLPSNAERGWQMLMVLYGTLAVILLILCFFITRERVAPPAQQKSDLKADLRELLANRPFAVIMLFLLFVLTAFVIKGSVSLYYFKYYVHREDLVGPFLLSNGLAFIAAVFLTQFIAKKFDKKLLLILSIGVGGLIVGGFWIAKPEDIALMMGLQIASSFVLGANSPLVWAMFADAADYGEWHTGRRNTGLVFAAAIFGTKVGVAIGAGVLSVLLSGFGYIPNVAQSAHSLIGIRLNMSFIPAVLLVIAAVIMYWYPLNDKFMEQIEHDLKQRKAAQS